MPRRASAIPAVSSTVRKTRRETCCTPFGPETTQSHIWRRRRLVPAVVFLFESSMTKKKNRAGTPPPDPASSLPVEAEVDYATPQTSNEEAATAAATNTEREDPSSPASTRSCLIVRLPPPRCRVRNGHLPQVIRCSVGPERFGCTSLGGRDQSKHTGNS